MKALTEARKQEIREVLDVLDRPLDNYDLFSYLFPSEVKTKKETAKIYVSEFRRLERVWNHEQI